ncbi:MAG: 6-carboxytetrahydropterin synthase [Bacteroidales bacterium]|nr:6-carboxytetrahydropterin synthase [Bacteroidales bacterium]MCF8404018.1 6-carboxytetrahydropterin synthase [Bacteroidales bacterium]
MANIRVTKEFTFEMAHALLGYDGSCKYVHGHSYGLSVTVKGKPIESKTNPKLGMVIDFGDLKKIVKENVVDIFDHALVLNAATPGGGFKSTRELFDKLIFVDYQPTSENMVEDFAHRIKSKLPTNMELFSLRLRETATSFAEWFASDQEG